MPFSLDPPLYVADESLTALETRLGSRPRLRYHLEAVLCGDTEYVQAARWAMRRSRQLAGERVPGLVFLHRKANYLTGTRDRTFRADIEMEALPEPCAKPSRPARNPFYPEGT